MKLILATVIFAFTLIIFVTCKIQRWNKDHSNNNPDWETYYLKSTIRQDSITIDNFKVNGMLSEDLMAEPIKYLMK